MGEITAQYDEAAFVWIDALDPADGEFATLQERFGLPRLAVKDSMSPTQVPRVDVYSDQIFVVLKLARLEGDEELADLTIAVGLMNAFNRLAISFRTPLAAASAGAVK